MTLEILKEILERAFPEAHYLKVSGIEGHFKLELCDQIFEGKSLIARHRVVNDLFKDSFHSGALHALSLDIKTPKEMTP